MTDWPDLERARILDAVRAGKMTPAQAETWARANGREPLEKRPDVSAHDPMKEELWTLPMAAAWFIWRSPHAVRDQWNKARKSWTKWIQLTDRPLKIPPRPLWNLKLFHGASLDDVFDQAGFHPWKSSQKELQFGFGRRRVGLSSNRIAYNPYDRFKASLTSGKLVATLTRPGEHEGTQIPAEYWIAAFEESEGGLDFKLLQTAYERTAAPEANLPEKPFESTVAVDLSDILDGEPNNWENPEFFFDDPPESDIYVHRERAIEAEKEVSQREFGRPDWGLEQALGWLAYRNANDFRSLGRAELKPPTYYGESYPPDFTNPHPEEALREALISGVLKGYLRGKEVAQAEWLHMAVWNAPGVKVRRDDVLGIETDAKTQPHVPRVLPREGASALAPGNNFDRPRARIDDAVAEGGRKRGGPGFKRAKGAIDKLWPDGVPDQVALSNAALFKTVADKVKEITLNKWDNVGKDTILRAAGRRK
jgi:hypothetical protein